jgi:hypothetical protein
VIDVRLLRKILCALVPDPVDGSESNPQPLLRRKVNTCDACHIFSLPGLLPLALLVLGVDADHAHHSAPVDHLALVTNLFYACPYFHTASLLVPFIDGRLNAAATNFVPA